MGVQKQRDVALLLWEEVLRLVWRDRAGTLVEY